MSGTKEDLNFCHISRKKHSGVIRVTDLLLKNDRATLYNFMVFTFSEAAISREIETPVPLIIRGTAPRLLQPPAIRMSS